MLNLSHEKQMSTLKTMEYWTDRMSQVIDPNSRTGFNIKGRELNQLKNAFDKSLEEAQECYMGIETFISQVNIELVGKDIGRSKSKYLWDGKSHKRIYGMGKSQVSYINDVLSANECNKVLVIIPFKLKGEASYSVLRTAGYVPGTKECSDRLFMSFEHDEDLREEFGIDLDNIDDAKDILYITDWIKNRVIDPSRVIFMSGGRQVYKSQKVFDKVRNAIEKHDCNHICFFFEPTRNHKKYKCECGPLYNQGIKGYTDAEVEWIKWIMHTVNDTRLIYANDITFAFSQDYRTALNRLVKEFGVKFKENLADNYQAYVKIVEKRIDLAINSECPNRNDEHFDNMINYFKDLLKDGIKSKDLTMYEIKQIMNYESKISNIVYRLDTKKYRNFFNIELIHNPGMYSERIYRISLHERFINDKEFKFLRSRNDHPRKPKEIEEIKIDDRGKEHQILEKFELTEKDSEEIDKELENTKINDNYPVTEIFDPIIKAAQTTLSEGLSTLRTSCIYQVMDTESNRNDIYNIIISNNKYIINKLRYKLYKLIESLSSNLLHNKQVIDYFNTIYSGIVDNINYTGKLIEFLVCNFEQFDTSLNNFAKFWFGEAFTFSKGLQMQNS